MEIPPWALGSCPYRQLTQDADQHLLTSEYEELSKASSMMNFTEMRDDVKENEAKYSLVKPGGFGSKKTGPRDEMAEDWDETSLLDMEDMVEDTLTQWTMDEELYVGGHHWGPRAGTQGGLREAGRGSIRLLDVQGEARGFGWEHQQGDGKPGDPVRGVCRGRSRSPR